MEKTLENMTKQEWESLCRGCGLCCLVKFQRGFFNSDKIYLTRVACDYLDLETKKCTCYETRYHENNGCGDLYIQTIKDRNLVPACCAYSEKMFGKAKNTPKIDWSKVIHEKDIPYGNSLKDYIVSNRDFFRDR